MATQEQKGKSNRLDKLWNNHAEISDPKMREGVKRRVVLRKRSSCNRRRPKRVIVKRRRIGGVVRRVRALKSLVPSTHSQGLDGLFTDTAHYILSLQMRVRVMRIMVNVLSANSQE